jgi:hypothetical protein
LIPEQLFAECRDQPVPDVEQAAEPWRAADIPPSKDR